MIRTLALKIACLNEQDTNWLMSHLTSEQQQKLMPLIGEAKEMGVAQDASLRQRLFALSDSSVNQTLGKKINSLAHINKLDAVWQSCMSVTPPPELTSRALSEIRKQAEQHLAKITYQEQK
ncbi:hypothetical protein [Catenovulum sediminis]|uniref:hypothetical protein n=1 Tax=Catenovulum sediminis TaxID=1740262 RepID=UPI00117E02FC|nr:hypothetical protein [Catenovulum sediminis]